MPTQAVFQTKAGPEGDFEQSLGSLLRGRWHEIGKQVTQPFYKSLELFAAKTEFLDLGIHLSNDFGSVFQFSGLFSGGGFEFSSNRAEFFGDGFKVANFIIERFEPIQPGSQTIDIILQ